MRFASRMAWSALWLAATLTVAPGLRAEPIADFYRGKTMKMIIGYGPGGGYDLYGRLAAEFLSRHIPGNPTIIPENMPGGGSLKAILYLYQVAPKDGTYLGSVSQQLAANAVTDENNKMDVAKFHYLGRLTSNIDVGVALPQAGIKSFEDASKRQVLVGAEYGAMSLIYALALNTYRAPSSRSSRAITGRPIFSSPPNAARSTSTAPIRCRRCWSRIPIGSRTARR